MDIKYKIVTIEDAKELDYSLLHQTSFESARKSNDGRVLISGEIEGVSREEILIELSTPEWNYEFKEE